MRRTARRPLAAGRLKPSVVLWFGVTLSAAGCTYLAIAVNRLASVLAILTLLTYLLLYTPLKRRTPLCILVGAFPGAMPPLIGWAAASGRLSPEAWILYTMLFLWQFPHFMAIAWLYREDYDRAGYRVLPQGKARDRVVSLQTMLPLLALFPIGSLPASSRTCRRRHGTSTEPGTDLRLESPPGTRRSVRHSRSAGRRDGSADHRPCR